MISVDLLHATRKNADESHIDFSINLWVLAEVSVGISVICTFMLPKFIEVEGPKVLSVFSRLARRFNFGRPFRVLAQGKEDTMVALQDLAPGDKIAMFERSSESDVVGSTNEDDGRERCPSYEGV